MGRELDRILALPERAQGDTPPLSPLLRRWSEHLWPVQVEALAVLENQPPPLGIYGDIGVGGGKFLIATLAGTVVKAKRPVVLTQPDLLRQAAFELDAFRSTFPEIEDHLPRYVAYSTLSQTGKGDLLYELAPDLIVLDEAHAVASRTSARGLRLREYAVANPSTRFVILSGTLNRKNLGDIYDLAELALRDTMWLPESPAVQEMWSSILDHKAQPGDELRERVLAPLLAWAKTRGVDTEGPPAEAYQAAYRERYLTTPGVVAPQETRVDASLRLRVWRPPTPPEIKEALTQLVDTWTLPDGTELVDALEYWRHAGTLSVGFYYRPIYRGDTSLVEEWLETRRLWGAAVRRQIQYIRWAGIDSPANVEAACVDGRAHPDVVRAYEAWAQIRDKVEPDSEPVWLTGALLDRSVERAQEIGRAIVWYASSTALEPELQKRGLRPYGAGSSAPRPNVDLPALSRRVHGTGKNLQAWDAQIVLEPPSSATAWEQMLGRTHRPGQLSDEVSAEVLATTKVARGKLYGAIAEADFVGRTSNKRHKITFCTWSP